MAIALDDEVRGIINSALASGAAMAVASVDPEGRPRLTFRGSLQTFGDQAVGFWARDPQGATMTNIASNPNVAMIMRNAATRQLLQLAGRARVAVGAERDRVYESAPQIEQQADPERKGAAVIVELDRVEGFLGLGPAGERRFVRMTRD